MGMTNTRFWGIFVGFFLFQWVNAVELQVYTGMDPEKRVTYKLEFEKLHPDITIKWIDGTTPVITEKIKNDNAMIQGDFIWGLSINYLYGIMQNKQLLGYRTANYPRFNRKFIETHDPPEWIGMNLLSAIVCYAPKLSALFEVDKPAYWNDLTDKKYKGQIIMPSPVNSSIGMLAVLNWIKIMGEEQAWNFMDQLHDNIDFYSPTASFPCQSVAIGNHLYGIGFDFRAIKLKESGADIDIIIPNGGVGWDIEAFGILKTTKNIESVKKLADFASSLEAEKLYSQYSSLTLHSAGTSANNNMPKDFIKNIKRNDYSFVVSNIDRIATEWKRRYGDKIR